MAGPGDPAESWLSYSTPEAGTRLYHYTDLRGLLGIMEGRSFWLTLAFALNDPSELDYGVTLAIQEITTALERVDPAFPAYRALTHLRTSVQSAYGPIHHPFVASFCEEGDLLSQWRAYGDRGGGYAVGIEPSERMHIGVPGTDHHDPSPYLRKVLYDPDEQVKRIRDFLGAFVGAVGEALNESAGSARRQLHRDELDIAPVLMASHAANYLFDLAISFKHPAFREEKEWRLLRVLVDHASPEQLCFREARGELVPYRPAHLYDVEDDGSWLFPLREVYVGPTLNARSTSAAVSLLIAHEATRDHPVSMPSRASIRPAAAAIR